jgi:fumarate reductase subunit D
VRVIVRARVTVIVRVRVTIRMRATVIIIIITIQFPVRCSIHSLHFKLNSTRFQTRQKRITFKDDTESKNRNQSDCNRVF